MGRVFDIQRFCLHDGAGLRTTIFLKGCPLRCRWCANPESQAPLPELCYNPGRCMDCGGCRESCPRSLIRPGDGGGIVVDRRECDACGACAEVCPKAALTIKGRELTAEEAVREAARDRVFHAASGGGVTLSGGEPLAQPGFLRELLPLLKKEGL
ncbi:MAG: glycyl-radical enzyme activating protein, partial [Planctomycetota bacterium]|nr:glycyl-radical enzyme activating protein [Planctomycetota bacterium]